MNLTNLSAILYDTLLRVVNGGGQRQWDRPMDGTISLFHPADEHIASGYVTQHFNFQYGKDERV